MKVSTDSCIFGALVAETFAAIELNQKNKISNYLDIGAGTGLLSLMLAQKTIGQIDAVEIDVPAYEQTLSNFDNAIFQEKLAVYNKDILAFVPDKKYHGIICNPPFFEGDLKSANEQKNTARHDTTLTILQLFKVAAAYLQQQGLLAVLLPYHRIALAIEIANQLNLHLAKKIVLQHTALHPYFRGILFFSFTSDKVTTQILTIKQADGNYTEAFTHLLKDYYLHL